MLLKHERMTVEKTHNYFYNEINFQSWEEYRDFLVSWRKKVVTNYYAFRGHADNLWKLKSTLDRIRPDLRNCDISSWYRSAEIHTIEKYYNVANIFKEKIDNNNNIIEKLAIMQHYGAATRLVDITYSPFVATFFALADIKYLNKMKCIWAIPYNIINERNKNILNVSEHDKLYKKYNELDIADEEGTDVIGISAYNNKLNERQFHQQGAFLYSMSNKNTIEDLLPIYFGDENTELLKMNFKIKDRNDFAYAINDLRSMNLTYSSLFPDLEGYGKETFIDQFIRNT